MKYLILCIFLLLITRTCVAQVNDHSHFFDYSYDKEKIKSNSISSVTISLYMHGLTLSKGKYFFDKEGRLLKINFSDSSGKPTSDYIFHLNNQNDVVSRDNYDYELGKNYEEKFYKKYDDNKLVFDSSSIMPVWYEYTYTNKGDVLQTITHNKFDPGFVITRNEYDTKNKLIEISEKQYKDSKDPAGTYRSHRIIHYNEKGRKTQEEELIDAPEYLMFNKGTIDYSYDDSGNLTQIKKEKAASLFYKYDRNNLIVAVKMDVDMKDDLFGEPGSKIVSGDGYTYEFRK